MWNCWKTGIWSFSSWHIGNVLIKNRIYVRVSFNMLNTPVQWYPDMLLQWEKALEKELHSRKDRFLQYGLTSTVGLFQFLSFLKVLLVTDWYFFLWKRGVRTLQCSVLLVHVWPRTLCFHWVHKVKIIFPVTQRLYLPFSFSFSHECSVVFQRKLDMRCHTRLKADLRLQIWKYILHQQCFSPHYIFFYFEKSDFS